MLDGQPFTRAPEVGGSILVFVHRTIYFYICVNIYMDMSNQHNGFVKRLQRTRSPSMGIMQCFLFRTRPSRLKISEAYLERVKNSRSQ